MGRRIDVQPDDGADLLGEPRVGGELEAAPPVRLQLRFYELQGKPSSGGGRDVNQQWR